MLVLKTLPKVNCWTSKPYFRMIQVHILDHNVHFSLSHSLLLDLNVHIWRSHCILWTSMSILNSRNSLRGVALRPRGDGGGGDGEGFPRTLDIWRSPGPTCPGTKYPVRGSPHFDYVWQHSAASNKAPSRLSHKELATITVFWKRSRRSRQSFQILCSTGHPTDDLTNSWNSAKLRKTCLNT